MLRIWEENAYDTLLPHCHWISRYFQITMKNFTWMSRCRWRKEPLVFCWWWGCVNNINSLFSKCVMLESFAENQALHTWIRGHPVILCRSSPALTGWMNSENPQYFWPPLRFMPEHHLGSHPWRRWTVSNYHSNSNLSIFYLSIPIYMLQQVGLPN